MEQYLHLYAEPEIAALDDLPDLQPWVNVVVIPACNERPEFLRSPPPCGGRSLMILVVNESVSAPDWVSSNNLSLANEVQKKFMRLWQPAPDCERSFGLKLYRDERASRDVLLVDRFSEGRQLPVKGGVGHARKIGVDLAACLIHRKRIGSPWIHCTDGDVRLPETYFTCSNTVESRGPECSALIYPFYHCDDRGNAAQQEVVKATQLYELSLRYYVAGMKYAQSPYAFHTIGSTIAVRASHYAKVRGFPKRAAGEDFYLLNKLAKVGTVLELEKGPDCKPLEIASRRSDRVPFGTGAAVNKITAFSDPVNDFRFYDPVVFELLKQWLHTWPEIWQSRSSDLSSSVFAGASGNIIQGDKQQWLVTGLKEIGTEKALDHAFRQSRDLHQFSRQMHTWFDAFRTLKLIHYLRDHHLSSISYSELEINPGFGQLLKLDTDLLVFHEYLQQFI